MKKAKTIILMALALLMILPFSATETQAADSYENAITFYNTASDQWYHCEFAKNDDRIFTTT